MGTHSVETADKLATRIYSELKKFIDRPLSYKAAQNFKDLIFQILRNCNDSVNRIDFGYSYDEKNEAVVIRPKNLASTVALLGHEIVREQLPEKGEYKTEMCTYVYRGEDDYGVIPALPVDSISVQLKFDKQPDI